MTETGKGIRIAVCDDRDTDRAEVVSMVEQYLEKNGHFARIRQFASGEALLRQPGCGYDLVILDIYMDKLNGIQTAKELLRRNSGVQIILCSSSNEFAAESYDVSALRYLIKPVQAEKLFAALDSFLLAHRSIRTLTVKVNRMDEQVYVSDILWIEADGHRCVIHTRKADVVTRASLSQLEAQLEGADFVHPIRYALVALPAVGAIPSDTLELVDGTVIPVSRDRKTAVKRAYTEYKMKTLLKKGGGR